MPHTEAQLGVLLEVVHTGEQEGRDALSDRGSWPRRGWAVQEGRLQVSLPRATLHGGQESTLLSMYTVFMHWGSLIVSPGDTDASVDAAGGNPYGTSYAAGDGGPVSEEALTAGRIQGRRLAEFAAKIATREDEDDVPADQAGAYTS